MLAENENHHGGTSPEREGNTQLLADAQTVINQQLPKEYDILIESAYFFGPRASSNFVRTPAHAWATLLLGSVASGIVANPAFFT